MFEFEFEREDDFTALRDLLQEVGYTEEAICRRMSIPSIYHFHAITDGRATLTQVESDLDALVRLFMDEESLEPSVMARYLPDGATEFLSRVGLIERTDQGRYAATVLIYPTEGLWISSDLQRIPEGKPIQDDAVYPAITRNTQHFLSSLPGTPCRTYLEMCSGTGIAALLAAEVAEHVWAVDVADRSTRCARFNARLNEIVNLTALTGNLYEPVEGMSFERIVAHPPYIPADKVEYIYRDAGADGEQVTRGVVQGAPEHLAPGGKLHVTCMVSDRTDLPFQNRLRQMLGTDHAQFDILVVGMGEQTPEEYFSQDAAKGRISMEELGRRRDVYNHLQVEALLYASIVVQRAVDRTTVFTARTKRGPQTTGREIDWLLRWEAAQIDADPQEDLNLAPKVTSSIRLFTIMEMNGSGWSPIEHNLGAEFPFLYNVPCPSWAPQFFERCDGVRTVREHLELLKQSGSVPPDASELEFVTLVRSLITAGLLQVASFPLPQSAGNQWRTRDDTFAGSGEPR